MWSPAAATTFTTGSTTAQLNDGAGLTQGPITFSAAEGAMQVYPNPWRADRGHRTITFGNLPSGSTVKLFTLAGRHVRTLSAPIGAAPWDLINESSEKVASGIYIYLVTTPNAPVQRG